MLDFSGSLIPDPKKRAFMGRSGASPGNRFVQVGSFILGRVLVEVTLGVRYGKLRLSTGGSRLGARF